MLAPVKTAAAMLFALGFVALSVLVKNDLRHQDSPLAGIEIGEKMPDFTLKDLSGADVSLAETVGANKVVAINFWASWCGPCRLEMPGFEKLYQKKHQEGFVLLAINEDEKPDEMTTYLRDKPVTFPVLIDKDGALMKRFKVAALPTTILVNQKGEIMNVTQGLMPFFSALVEVELKNGQTKK
jgi:thiol-disulfide isomerase/thioredoxin